MNISDLVKTLEEIKEEYGDIPVCVKGDYDWEDTESIDIAYKERYVKIGV